MNPDTGALRASEPAAEVLRTVVHDLRQPLSSIETIAYYLTLILPRTDEKIQAQLHEIRHLVEQANRILTSGVLLASATESVGETKLPPQMETEAASLVQVSPVQGNSVQGNIVPQPLGLNAA
jgi:signal transduction histidine kinase